MEKKPISVGNVDVTIWRQFSAWVASTGQNKSQAVENALRRATPVAFKGAAK